MREVRFPKEVGMEPVRLFCVTTNILIWVRRPSSDGILPERLLYSRRSRWIFKQLERLMGMVP